MADAAGADEAWTEVSWLGSREAGWAWWLGLSLHLGSVALAY